MNQKMLKQLQDMQKQMMKAQEELGKEEVEGTAGGGRVRIRMTGHSRVVGVTIDPEVLDPDDLDLLQDMVMAAINDASDKVQELTQQRMGALTGGRVPGLF